jgi:small subunit ribosomal protein S1
METETLAANETPETSETLEAVDVNSITNLKRKMQFTGTVIKTTLAGAVVNIGMEVPGVLHISQLQLDPVNRVEDVIHTGQTVDVWVRRVFPKKKRVELTMIKPLDLEWREIEKDMVIKGKVTRLEKFGAFVDIGAERPGLVHISEMTHNYIKSVGEVVKEGDEVEVKVLNVNRQKKQIKLSMKALEEKPVKVVKETLPQPKEPTAPATVAEEVEKPIPTAMEMALREAMERSKEKEKTVEPVIKGKRRPQTGQAEMERILERTLNHKVRTSK